MIKMSFAIGIVAGGPVMLIAFCWQILPVLISFLLLFLILAHVVVVWIIITLLKDNIASNNTIAKKFKGTLTIPA